MTAAQTDADLTAGLKRVERGIDRLRAQLERHARALRDILEMAENQCLPTPAGAEPWLKVATLARTALERGHEG